MYGVIFNANIDKFKNDPPVTASKDNPTVQKLVLRQIQSEKFFQMLPRKDHAQHT